MSDVGKWSTTASKNNKPAPNGWPEGMAPSEVNDSAREGMAAVKRMMLDFPYFSTGGVVTYINETSFSIADDDNDENYARFFPLGRKIKVVAPGASYLGIVVSSEYSGGVTTVTVGLDEASMALPTAVTDVLVGLQYEDISNAAGPNMLGMVLPYTADIDSVPFGFGLANGEAFNPDIYKALADLYRTGTDSNGSPTYKYGTSVVNGNIWPNKPDVRGYFPRFLDTRANNDNNKVDPDAPRTVGSIQGASVGAHGHILRASSDYGNTSDPANTYPAGRVYASGAERVTWNSNYNRDNAVAVPKLGNAENRPANIALPGLLVMYGGYASADMIPVEDVVDVVTGEVLPAVNLKLTQVDDKLQDQDAKIAQIDAKVTGVPVQHTVTISATDWTDSKTYVATVNGLTTDNLVVVGPAPTEADREIWGSSGVYASAQASNKLTFTCTTVPTEALTINIGVFPA